MNRLYPNTSTVLTLLELRREVADDLRARQDWQAGLYCLCKQQGCKTIWFSQDLENKERGILMTDWENKYLEPYTEDLDQFPGLTRVWPKVDNLLESSPHSELVDISNGTFNDLSQLHELTIVQGDENLVNSHLIEQMENMLWFTTPNLNGASNAHLQGCCYGLMPVSKGIARFLLLCSWTSVIHRLAFKNPEEDTDDVGTRWEDFVESQLRDLRTKGVNIKTYMLELRHWPSNGGFVEPEEETPHHSCQCCTTQ